LWCHRRLNAKPGIPINAGNNIAGKVCRNGTLISTRRSPNNTAHIRFPHDLALSKLCVCAHNSRSLRRYIDMCNRLSHRGGDLLWTNGSWQRRSARGRKREWHADFLLTCDTPVTGTILVAVQVRSLVALPMGSFASDS